MGRFERDLKILTVAALVLAISGTALVASFCGGYLGNNQIDVTDSISIQSSVMLTTPHEPILINNDTQLTSAAISNSWPGSGSHDDPYLVEALEINAVGHYSAIFIGNTTKAIEINNCLLHNATMASGLSAVTSPYNTGSGLVLFNVHNVSARSNLCTNNSWSGILVFQSENIIIESNDCNNNSDGIRLTSSSHNQIVGNDCRYNLINGLFADESHHNLIENNSFCHSINEMGMDLAESSNNVIRYNICSDNELGGIELQGNGPENLIANNTIERNGDGIYLALSSSNIFENNTCKDNTVGIHLFQFMTPTTNNTIRNNRINDSTSFGVKLNDECSGNRLYGNVFSNNNGASSTYDSSHIQAYDDGANYWNASTTGNQWSDWRSPDANNDGIIDSAYIIAGGSNHDMKPIAWTGSDLPSLDSGVILVIVVGCVVAIPIIGGIWYVRRKRKTQG